MLLSVLAVTGCTRIFYSRNISSSQPISPPLAFIHIEGNKFVDANNQEFIFRGVSLSDPGRLYNAGQWNKAYFQAAKDWNANIVRFPIHPSFWRSEGKNKYLQLLDDGIQWATELGLYVIIDWHTIGDLQTERFQHPRYRTTKAETYSFWQTIAERYKNNPTVALYELFNEPRRRNNNPASSWSDHKKLMEEIIAIIFAEDETAIPLVAGFNWAYDLTPIRNAPINSPGVAYVVHPYPQKRDAPWQEKWEKDWGYVANDYPIFATEIGFQETGPGAIAPVIGTEVYGEAIIDYFNSKGISWTAWVFDPQWTPQLITNWNFEASQQGIFFQEKLKRLNN